MDALRDGHEARSRRTPRGDSTPDRSGARGVGPQAGSSRADAEEEARRPRPCRLESFGSLGTRFSPLPDELLPSQPSPHNLTHGGNEAVTVVQQCAVCILAVIETERLLIDIAKQVERLDRNVGSAQRSLQQTPEVLNAIAMNLSVDVFDGVVHDLVFVFCVHPVLIGELSEKIAEPA